MKRAVRFAIIPATLLVVGTFIAWKSKTPAIRASKTSSSAKAAWLKAFTPPAIVPAASVGQVAAKVDTASAGQPSSLKVLPVDPSIQKFSEIQRKSLRSRAEMAEMKTLLRHRQVLQTAFDQLSDFDSEIPARTQLVSYIQEALLDKENPERELIETRAEQLILADNLRPEQNRPHRRELAADKGELTLAFLDAQPGRRQHLIEASAGSPNLTVIRNALAVGERRRAESLRILEELPSSSGN